MQAEASPEALTAFLEGKGLSSILRDFVSACAERQPDDIVEFMRDWALERRPLAPPAATDSGVSDAVSAYVRHGALHDVRDAPQSEASESPAPSHLSQTPGRLSPTSLQRGADLQHPQPAPFLSAGLARTPMSRSGTPKSATKGKPASASSTRFQIACVLGGDKSNRHVLTSVIEDAASWGGAVLPTAPDSAVGHHVRETGHVLESINVKGAWVAGLAASNDARTVAFVAPQSLALDDDTLRAVSVSDSVVLVGAADSVLADLRVKRQGELYNRGLAAHALGVKRALLVITGAKAVDGAGRREIERELSVMTSACGFDEIRTRVVFMPATADDMAEALVGLPTAPSVKYAPAPARFVSVSAMVLNGTGITAGDVVSGFAQCPVSMRVESVEPSRSTQSPRSDGTLRVHQTGMLSLSTVSGEPVPVATAGPFLVHRRGRILAMGSVTNASLELPAVDDDEDAD